MQAFEAEENSQTTLRPEISWSRAQVMERGWETGQFFYVEALKSLAGAVNVFAQHVQKRYTGADDLKPEYFRCIAPFWRPDIEDIVTSKVEDRKQYEAPLRKLFVAEGQAIKPNAQ